MTTSTIAISATKKTSLPSAPVSQPLALAENPPAETFHHAKKVERRSTTAPPPATHVERLTALASKPCVLMPPPVSIPGLASGEPIPLSSTPRGRLLPPPEHAGCARALPYAP